MSSLNFNQVTIAGHITEAPELRQTTSGRAVCTFTVAVNRRRAKDGTQAADFLTVVAWEKTAEFVVQYFPKGAAIRVGGSIQTRKWQDKDGNNRYATEIVADEAMFVDGKTDAQSENNAHTQDTGFSAPTYAPPTAPKFEELKTDDDLPF
jgi:single-strand DNA-binding protein